VKVILDPYASFATEDYDELQFLEQHAAWAGLSWTGTPTVTRHSCVTESGRLSYLRWGSSDPEVALVHGTGQNAHTWDTFVLALGRPCVALDLPGHGRSDWRTDGDYFPAATTPAVAQALAHRAAGPQVLVGMSLGGLTALSVATARPEFVRALVLVDITPGRPEIPAGDRTGAPMPLSLLSGPERYPSWDAMLEATHATMPHRERSTLVPGLRHNARPFEDGGWGWRYDRLRPGYDPRPALEALWENLEALRIPVLLVRGGRSPLVTDDKVDRLLRTAHDGRALTIDEAGHSVQTDRPVELAAVVEDLLHELAP